MTGLTEKWVFLWNRQKAKSKSFWVVAWNPWIDELLTANSAFLVLIDELSDELPPLRRGNTLDHSAPTLYVTCSAHDPLATVPCLTHGTNFTVVWFIFIFVPNHSRFLFMVHKVLCQGVVCVYNLILKGN